MMLPCQKHITSFTAHSVKSQTCITTGKALYHDIIWSWTTLRPHFLHSSQADYAAVMFACLPFVPRLLNAIFFVRNTLSLLFVYQVATQTSLLQRFLRDNPTKPWVVSSATTFSPLPGFILFIALSTNWFAFFFKSISFFTVKSPVLFHDREFVLLITVYLLLRICTYIVGTNYKYLLND